MRQRLVLVALTLTLATCALTRGVSRVAPPNGDLGEADVALAEAPPGVSCLRVVVASANRTEIRKFSLPLKARAVLRLRGLPVGNASFSADAFRAECSHSLAGITPPFYSDPVAVEVNAGTPAHVSLRIMERGRAAAGPEFDDESAPDAPEQPNLAGGTFSSAQPYVVPVDPGVRLAAVLTVGDSPSRKPDGTPYRMVGNPDGLGAFDNGDGTLTLLMNHELAPTSGVVRAHGATGAFVSKWIIRKADLAVMSGSDLIQRVALWNPATASYDAPPSGVALGQLCSADLPAPSALHDAASGKGFDGRLLLGGEEVDEGRALAHGMDGTTWELPRLGRFRRENSVANASTGEKTVLVGTEDSRGGHLYVYAGDKTTTGSPVDKAGLTNGVLYGVRVPGHPLEDVAAGIPKGRFDLVSFGSVESRTGKELGSSSAEAMVTGFCRPEDVAWDPNSPNDLYFATTASFSTPSRLFRLRFVNVRKPELGGEISTLLDGSEGHRMLDNLAVDQTGHVYLEEDVGDEDHRAKIWRYDLGNDSLTLVAQESAVFFDPMSTSFTTNDEESSGILDMSEILGPGWFFLGVQAHKDIPGELVQGGQLLAMFDPASAG